jgi:hypothetical protein
MMFNGQLRSMMELNGLQKNIAPGAKIKIFNTA